MSDAKFSTGHSSGREERLRAATVGPLQVHGGIIVLAEYDSNWPRLFEREETRIRAALGDRVLCIEHVGSTSVPGLPAKPIIDIVLVVQNSADETFYVSALAGAGYVLRIREPEWHEHRMFKGSDPATNLHVFSHGSPEIDRMVVFRDWLCRHAPDRELYERTKRTLAQQEWKYVQDYADAKSAVVEEILARAGAGSQANGKSKLKGPGSYRPQSITEVD